MPYGRDFQPYCRVAKMGWLPLELLSSARKNFHVQNWEVKVVSAQALRIIIFGTGLEKCKVLT